VHQPLHVSFPDDRGGNNIGVSGGLCSWDLHAVWDSCILEEGLSMTHTRSHGTFLIRSPARTGPRGVPRGRSTGRHESFAISVSPKRRYCPTDSGCWCDTATSTGPGRAREGGRDRSGLHRDQHAGRQRPPSQGRGPTRGSPEPGAGATEAREALDRKHGARRRIRLGAPRSQHERRIQLEIGAQQNWIRCRSQATGNGCISSASCGAGRPSRIRSTMSGARSVRRSTRHT
jgi:hypothetical protein